MIAPAASSPSLPYNKINLVDATFSDKRNNVKIKSIDGNIEIKCQKE